MLQKYRNNASSSILGSIQIQSFPKCLFKITVNMEEKNWDTFGTLGFFVNCVHVKKNWTKDFKQNWSYKIYSDSPYFHVSRILLRTYFAPILWIMVPRLRIRSILTGSGSSKSEFKKRIRILSVNIAEAFVRITLSYGIFLCGFFQKKLKIHL